MAASRGCLELALLLVLLAVARRRQALLSRRLSAAGSLAAGDEAQQPLLPGRRRHELQQAVVDVEDEWAPRAQTCWPPALLASLEIGWAAAAALCPALSTIRPLTALPLHSQLVPPRPCSAYITAGNLAHLAGLSIISAARGAFLIQATAVFTPLLAALAGAAPSRCGRRLDWLVGGSALPGACIRACCCLPARLMSCGSLRHRLTCMQGNPGWQRPGAGGNARHCV